jgi:HK97 gp10 family phage protein
MAGVTVEVKGFKELLSKFDKLPLEKQNKVETAMRIGALKIESDAEARVPVKTGALKIHIQSKVERKKDSISATIGPNAANPTGDIGYSTYVEFGTSKMKAQPYLLPALEENKEQLIRNIKKAIE